MLALIPLLPFAGFVVNAFLGKRLPKTVSGGVACLVMLASFAVSVISVLNVADPWTEVTLFRWMASGDLQIPLTLRLDHLSSLMILVITGIGSLIHIYSTAYMHEERDSEFARYFSYLNLFASFMLVLVLGANFLVMFVGWEGVGLCSYLLIGFYHLKKSANDAGKKAFIVNRVGDFGFVLGVLLLFSEFHSVDFQEIANAVSPLNTEVGFGTLSIATLLLFVGATGTKPAIDELAQRMGVLAAPRPLEGGGYTVDHTTSVFLIDPNGALHALFSAPHSPKLMRKRDRSP
jgi:NADH-quinone oxidoreductase subunit L